MFEYGVKDDVCWMWDTVGEKAGVYIPRLVTIGSETPDKTGYCVKFSSNSEPPFEMLESVKKEKCFWTVEELVNDQIVKSCHKTQERIDRVTADHEKEIAALKKILEKLCPISKSIGKPGFANGWMRRSTVWMMLGTNLWEILSGRKSFEKNLPRSATIFVN